MIIKKLYLSSFGKFTNKTIDLSKKINILYGLNEAGKSTIHKFIEGMLFGFFKTGVKNRSLNDDHSQYHPRAKTEYFGSMEIEFNNETYLIYRDFNKSKPAITITNQKTGKDITDTLQQHPATKLPDLAAFLGISYTLYKNTISIAQQEHKDDKKNLANTVVEKLTNLHTTKDEAISLVRINESINKELEDIGTIRAKTKPLFLSKEKVEHFKNEMEVSKIKYEEINNLNIEMHELLSKQESFAQLNSELTNMQKVYENEIKKAKYNRAVVINEEYTVYEDLTSKLIDYKGIDSQSYHSYISNEELYNELKNNSNHLKQEINSYVHKQEELYPRLNQLNYNLHLSYNKAKIEELKNNRISPIVVILLSIITLTLFFFINRKKNYSITQKIEELKEAQKLIKHNEIELGQYNDMILNAHSDSLYADSISTSSYYKDIQSNYNQLMQLSGEIKLFDDRVREKSETLDLVSKRIETILEKNRLILLQSKVHSKEQLLESIKFKDEYTESHIKMTETKKRLQDLLGGQSISSLESQIDFSMEIEFDEEELKKIKSSIRENYDAQLSLNSQINQKNAEILHIERNHRELDLVLNDYKNSKEIYNDLLNDSKVLEKVQSVLGLLSDEISYEFAPILNEEVSKIINSITNHKYNDIKVDKELHVKVFDTATNSNEDIAFFSKGTIDQLYLALRIGVNNILSNCKYPFIFDDSFVNYDDDRLIEVLKLLQNESEHRQIILLSCHQREIEYFENEKVKINSEEI